MKRKLIAVGLVLCMTGAMTGTALADTYTDGSTVTHPNGTAVEAGEIASNGEAVMTSEDGKDFYTENDDDTDAKDVDTNGADINVWAKVTDSGSKIYKVDLAWGAMKFEFNSGAGQWNTETHTYEGGGGTASWTEGYIDGTNNKIQVTNHSNNGIDAAFAYAMGEKAFNDTDTSDNAVLGNFFAENTNAQTAAKVLTGTYTDGTVNAGAVADTLADKKIALATADKYNSSVTEATDAADNHEAGARSEDVFFAFSGTPDEGRGAILDTFKKVGVITVTVTPNTELQYNQPQYTAP